MLPCKVRTAPYSSVYPLSDISHYSSAYCPVKIRHTTVLHTALSDTSHYSSVYRPVRYVALQFCLLHVRYVTLQSCILPCQIRRTTVLYIALSDTCQIRHITVLYTSLSDTSHYGSVYCLVRYVTLQFCLLHVRCVTLQFCLVPC